MLYAFGNLSSPSLAADKVLKVPGAPVARFYAVEPIMMLVQFGISV